MPLNAPAAYLVLDARGYVVGHEMRLEYAEAAEVDHRTATGSRNTRVVYLADADVATLARIAAVDCEALTRKGSGCLGAGTHPAQPYLEVMLHMRGVTVDMIPGMTFGHDRVADCINAFLGNAGPWRGETARAVKAALKVMAANR